LAGGAVLAAGAAVGGCGDPAAPVADGRQGVREVTVLTGAGFQGREAPLFVASVKGWLADEGLTVQVVPGKGTGENLKTLAAGRATFATLDVSGAMIEFMRPGGIRDFTLTGVLHQRNLACFVALAESGITTPRDLADRTLSFIPGGINKDLFATYAKLAQFDASKVVWVGNPNPQQHVTMLAARQVDAISQFVPAVEQVKAVTGKPVTVLPFTDVIGDLYGSAIGVTTQTARTSPDLVRGFNRALRKGLQWTIDHPDEAAQIYADQDQTKGQPNAAAAAKAEIEGMTGYVKGIGDTPLGMFDPLRAARNIGILQGAGTIPDGLTPDQIITLDLAG